MIRCLAIALAFAASLAEPARAETSGKYARVDVPAGIDHTPWDRLLRKYVDGSGLVDYPAWKASGEDRGVLNDYLARFAPAAAPARGEERAASLINAYNAFTISWMVGQYPVASIRATPKPFDGRRHEIGGRKVSLDDIEHGALRPEYGFRIHAAISCASRSCPPLAARAWEAESLDVRLDAGMRTWLAREDLNRFQPDRRKADLSAIFKWFAGDFEKAGGVRQVLARYAPEADRASLATGDYSIGYLAYDWGLNDQGKEGRDYGGLRSLWDRLS